MTEPTTLRMGLIRKKPGWTDEAFRNHWRDSHGPLVAQLPTLRAYRQNLVVDRLQRGIDFARGPWDFDGFSQLRFDAAAQAGDAFSNGELAAAIRADEAHFLGGLHIVSVAQTEVIALPPKPEACSSASRCCAARLRKPKKTSAANGRCTPTMCAACPA
ncbi:EthD domain-containing protein [Variovorax sp. RB3P1]|uniref:EthD domain-containing protein n=1 Tax=Variovorax sp. RB3P1 TaxID=3443732 RepID=UPI003F476644